MTCLSRIAVSGCALFFALSSASAKGKAAAPFTPFDKWKAAVAAGDSAALAKLYSTNPPAKITVGKDNTKSLDDELQYWAGLKASGITSFNPKVLSLEISGDRAQLVLRVQVETAKENIVAGAAQLWIREPSGWRIAASQLPISTPTPAAAYPSLRNRIRLCTRLRAKRRRT